MLSIHAHAFYKMACIRQFACLYTLLYTGHWQLQTVRTELGTMSKSVTRGKYNAKYTLKRAVTTSLHINNAIPGMSVHMSSV